MARPKYTREDMQVLAGMSSPTSIPAVFLPVMDYDPLRFKNFLEEKGLHKDVQDLFVISLGKVPPMVTDESKQGYLKFRMVIGK